NQSILTPMPCLVSAAAGVGRMACGAAPSLWRIHRMLLHRSPHTFLLRGGGSSDRATPVSCCSPGDRRSVRHGVLPSIAAGYPCHLARRSGPPVARLPLCSRRNLTQSPTAHPLWLPSSFHPSRIPP